MSEPSSGTPADVLVIGDGVAGRSAALFTARHGRKTIVVGPGRSLLRRNAHLENYPGFPAGVNARLLLDLMGVQAERAGGDFRTGEVDRLERDGDGFVATTVDGDAYLTDCVVAATKNEVGYLEGLSGLEFVEVGKRFVVTDERGRTGVDGLYAAGRLARKPHQTIVAAGHGAEVAVTLLEDADAPFYHDWVAPEGYFTGRDREVPPGCEEIDLDESRRREAAAMALTREWFAEPHPAVPEQHPRVADDSADR